MRELGRDEKEFSITCAFCSAELGHGTECYAIVSGYASSAYTEGFCILDNEGGEAGGLPLKPVCNKCIEKLTIK